MFDDKFYNYEDLIDDEYSDSDEETRNCTQCPASLAVVTSRLEPLTESTCSARHTVPNLWRGCTGNGPLGTHRHLRSACCRSKGRQRSCGQNHRFLPSQRFGPEPGPASIDPAIPMEQRGHFANSVYLKTEDSDRYRDPPYIIIHPGTSFGLNVRDFTQSTPVNIFPEVLFNDNIRLPRPHTMVDAIVDIFLEHGKGLVTTEGSGQLVVWLVSIIEHGFRTGSMVPGEGQDAQSLLDDIKEENKPYFKAWIHWDKSKADLEYHSQQRKAIIDLKEA